VLDSALNHGFAVVATAVALCAGSFYIPPLIGAELEPSTRVEKTQVMQRMAAIIQDAAPAEAGPSSSFYDRGTNSDRLRIDLVPASVRNRSASEVANALREKMHLEPGMLVQTRVSSATLQPPTGD
jgi:hypothetical protein